MQLLIDPQMDPAAMRAALYDGGLVVLSKLPSVERLALLARQSLGELFSPIDPRRAHLAKTPEQLAELLGEWKPRFIHSWEARVLTEQIVVEAGMRPEDIYLDLPKPRTSFGPDSLTTGIAFAFPWHRDTWYCAPQAQINWWLPIWPVRDDNAMEFDTSVFDVPVPNNSGDFDYYRQNVARLSTAQHVGSDPRVQPGALDWHCTNPLAVLPPPGSILLFAAAHLHRSIPNTSGVTRYSIDFRTVDIHDVRAGRSAPDVDCACTGTAIRDFVNVNGDHMPEDVVRLLEPVPPPPGTMTVFEPRVMTSV